MLSLVKEGSLSSPTYQNLLYSICIVFLLLINVPVSLLEDKLLENGYKVLFRWCFLFSPVRLAWGVAIIGHAGSCCFSRSWESSSPNVNFLAGACMWALFCSSLILFWSSASVESLFTYAKLGPCPSFLPPLLCDSQMLIWYVLVQPVRTDFFH